MRTNMEPCTCHNAAVKTGCPVHGKYALALDRLEQVLLAHGGREADLSGPEYHLDELLADGRQFDTAGLRQARGRWDWPHANAAWLWMKPKNRRCKIVTGYGLGADGVWRQHTWLARNGSIVETAAPRLLYFGCELGDKEAAWFCVANLCDLEDL